MTSARIQPFCKNYLINIGCFDGMRISLRIMTHRNISLFIYNNHFCLIWKSNGISFNQEIEELKINFQVFSNDISDNHLKRFAKFEYDPDKLLSL